jgi:hypothetical protein
MEGRRRFMEHSNERRIQLEQIASQFDEIAKSLATGDWHEPNHVTFERFNELRKRYDYLRSAALPEVGRRDLDQSTIDRFEAETDLLIAPRATRLEEITALRETASRASKRLTDLCSQFENPGDVQ